MTRPLAIILLLAALIRFGLLVNAYPEAARVLREDSTGSYIPLAHVLLSHGRFAEKPEAAPDIFRTPGYPAFLAAAFAVAGDSVWRALAVQVLVSLLTIALVWYLATMLVSPRAAPVAALVMALDPPSTTHSVLLLTETVFTALIAAACVLLWRAVRNGELASAAAGGLSLGLAVLVRPIALYVGPLGGLFVLAASRAAWPRRIALAALALALSLAPPVCWMARNAQVGAGFILSNIEGMNLLFYRAAPVLAKSKGITWTQAMDELGAELSRRAGHKVEYGTASSQASKQLALEVLAAHPGGTALMVAEGTLRFWAAPGNADLMLLLGVIELGHEARWPEKGPPLARALGWAAGGGAQVVHIAVLIAALCGIVAWVRERRWLELAFAVGLMGVFTVLSAGPGAYARFRVPVVPMVALLAAACRERRLARAEVPA